MARLVPLVERLAVSSSEPGLRLWGHIALGVAHYFQHEYPEALAHFDQSVTLLDGCDPRQPLERLLSLETEGMLYCHTYSAMLCASQANPDRARQHCQRAMSLAKQTGHLYTQVLVLTTVVFVEMLLGNLDRALELPTRALETSLEQVFTFWLALSKGYHSWTLTMRGEHQTGVRELQESVARIKAIGCMVVYPLFQGLLGEALLQAGDLAAGLAAVQEGRRADRLSMGRDREMPELSRLEGELLALAGEREQAIDCLKRAVQSAAAQGAGLFVARARAALARSS